MESDFAGILWFFGLIVSGFIWGCVTQKVIENKGYDDYWFWWGFFFGIFALIVACTKPQNTYSPPTEPTTYDRYMASKAQKSSDNTNRTPTPIVSNTWRCSCGQINPHYVYECTCGAKRRTLQEQLTEKKISKSPVSPKNQHQDTQLLNLQLLREYKELLDSGIITQEEFDKKKSELL